MVIYECYEILTKSWWRHQMETFSVLLAICAGNSPVTGEFPTQRPVTRSFDVYFDLRPNERLSKQSRGWWFETLSSPLWRHRNIPKHRRLLHHPMSCHWNTFRIWWLLCRLAVHQINIRNSVWLGEIDQFDPPIPHPTPTLNSQVDHQK